MAELAAPPAQILIRAQRVDLSAMAAAVREAAPGLPHPALEAAALDHAGFLGQLAAGRDLLARQVLIAVREPPARRRRRPPPRSPPRRRAAGAGRRRSPSPCWTAAQAAAVLAGCCDPARPMPARRRAARPGHHRPLRSHRAGARGDPAAAPARPAPMPPAVTAWRRPSDPAASGSAPGTSAPGTGTRRPWRSPGTRPRSGPAGSSRSPPTPAGSTSACTSSPIPAAVAAARLRAQRARLESTRRRDDARGRLDDPDAEAAADDARDLAYRIARGEGHLFRAGLYLTVWARTEDTSHAEVDRGADAGRVAAAAGRARPPSARCRAGSPACRSPATGWACGGHSTPPRSPPASRSPPPTCRPRPGQPPRAGRGAVRAERRLGRRRVLGPVGAGQPQQRHPRPLRRRESYLAKLDILRSLYAGVQAAVIDPEDEYARLAARRRRHDHPPRRRRGPSQPPRPARPARGAAAAPDGLMRRALFLHTFLAVLLGGQPDPAARAVLDQAIMACYHAAGITADPRTWARPAPLLADLAAALRAEAAEAAAELAARLHPWTAGTHCRACSPGRPPPGPPGTWSCAACATCPRN